jgi:hypothetical protein
MSIPIVRRKDLPWSEVAHEFVGDEHGRVPSPSSWSTPS